MPTAPANGIELCYEVLGADDAPPLLMIRGLGSQLVSWDPSLLEVFVDAGFRVIVFDNRDVGRSTWLDDGPVDADEAYRAFLAGEDAEVPYTLSDMAADAAGLLDALGIGAAHVLGISLGGMVAQALTIEHPDRVLSLTSVMSHTGEPGVGGASREALEAMSQEPAEGRDAAIEQAVAASRVYASPDHFDEDAWRARHALEHDRAHHPEGQLRQVLAVMGSPPRAEGLRSVEVPTVVIHGEADPLVQVDGGRRTAELIPDAELVVIDGMGHDLPEAFWGAYVDAVRGVAGRTAHPPEAVAADREA